MWRCFFIGWVVLAAASTQSAAADVKAAQRQVQEFLDKASGGQRFARVTVLADAALAKVAPDSHWFGVLFPQFPVGVAPPAPLMSANVLVVDKADKLHVLSDIAALEKYCRVNFLAVATETGAQAAVRAWLLLAQQIHTDGFFQFDLALPFAVEFNDMKKPVKVQGTANVKPQGGNKGHITATLNFDATGKLTSIQHTAKLLAGIRPICQATRLLDADPVIRQMAERDLLVMGQACREYLLEQRSKANRELQREIDRVWQRIVEEDR